MGCQPSTMVARLLSRFHLLPVPPARINVPTGSMLHRALAGEDLRPELRALGGLKPVEDPDAVNGTDDSDPMLDILRRRPTKDRRMKELTPERIRQVQRQSRWMLQAFPFEPSPTLATIAAWDQARRFHRIIPQREPVDPSSTFREQLQQAEERRVRMQHAAEDRKAGRQRTLAMISLDLADQVAEIDWVRARGVPQEQRDEIVRAFMLKERERAKKRVAEVADETAARRARIAQRDADKAAGRERDAAQDKADDEAEAKYRHLALTAAGGRTPSLSERDYIVEEHMQAKRSAAEARLLAFDAAEMHQLDDPDMVDESDPDSDALAAARSELDRPLDEDIDVDEEEEMEIEAGADKTAAIEAGEAKEGEAAAEAKEGEEADKVAEKKEGEEAAPAAAEAEDDADAAELDAQLKALGADPLTVEEQEREAALSFAEDREAERALKTAPEQTLHSLSSVRVEEVELLRRFNGAEQELAELVEQIQAEAGETAPDAGPQFEQLTLQQRQRLIVDKLHAKEESDRQAYVAEQRAIQARNVAKIAADARAGGRSAIDEDEDEDDDGLVLEPVDTDAIKFDDYLMRERNAEAAEAAKIEAARIDADAAALDDDEDGLVLEADAEADRSVDEGVDAEEEVLVDEKEALVDQNEEIDLDEEEVRQMEEKDLDEEPADEADEEEVKGRGRKDE